MIPSCTPIQGCNFPYRPTVEDSCFLDPVKIVP